MDAGEAGAAGVGEEAEEALVWFKVAGSVDQLHVPGSEGSLVQGRAPRTPFKAQHKRPPPRLP